MVRLAEALDVSLDYLAGRSDGEESEEEHASPALVGA
jgi:hypothetical protein